MKSALQFVTSMVALGGLLGSVASHATDLAELPLKASVLAKPNVIWGMDDSGSMDWEFLLNTPSGVAYWDGTTAWDSGTNAPRTSSGAAGYAQLSYLFPMGVNIGGQLYTTSSNNGRAAPPIAQMAWMRSWRFNPIYYNPAVTYKPWSPAYAHGATRTYANASTTAAPGHPQIAAPDTPPTIDLTKAWDSSVTNFADNNYAFRVYGGMTLPAGTSVVASTTYSGVCDGGTRRTLTATTTVAAGESCIARIPYFPATYWHPTVCPSTDKTCVPAPDCTISAAPDSDCVASPDGSGKLRRYEIKAAVTSYPTGRTYTAELQNFANWFTYHRKRKLMLAGSMGAVLENITGLRMDVVPFNSLGTVTMDDADSTDITQNRFAVAGRFYTNAMVGVGTPTLATLKHIGTQVDTDANVVKYACQKNNAFIVTDGFANDKGVTAPAYTPSKYGGDGAPYQTTEDGTLAALALAYYNNRLRETTSPLPAGLVPTSSATDAWADKNPDLHLNVYAISLGLSGSLWTKGANAWTSPPTWTTPVNDSISMLDDLWHATVNGRGRMYLATSPTETFQSITDGLNEILNDTNAQSSVAVSTVNLQSGDGLAYMASYNAAGWSGNVTANPINTSTAEISDTPTWDAGALLLARDPTTRVIASYNGTAGVAFTEAAVGSLVNPSSTWGTTADVMAYLRGNRTLEGTTFRSRTSLLGAVINAEPVISRDEKVLYVASGEGMLHAFEADKASTDKGKELWAFVPRAVLGDIGQTTARSYAFKTQLDGTPVVGKVSSTGTKLLVGGMGAAGRAYYALDVTAPRSNTEANASTWVKWQFPLPSDTTNVAKIGQTVGKPVIVRLASGDYRVLVTSGYNSTADGKGRLFVLDPADGTVLKEFTTADGSLTNEAGLTHVSAYAEDDGSTRYVYGGDLLGNLWRFDLDAASGSAPHKVAALTNSSGVAQPVTAAPELVSIGTQRVVLVGTGKLLDVTDWGTNATNTFYAIADGATLATPRSTLVQQTYVRSTDTLTASAVDWGTQRGWFVDLPTKEHANTRPAIAYGGVAFVTNIAGANDCSASSYLYVIDVEKGDKVAGATSVSEVLFDKANSTGITAVVTATGDLRGMVRSYDGERKQPALPGKDIINPSKNSWREVRQR